VNKESKTELNKTQISQGRQKKDILFVRRIKIGDADISSRKKWLLSLSPQHS